jgi:hypothetical protein
MDFRRAGQEHEDVAVGVAKGRANHPTNKLGVEPADTTSGGWWGQVTRFDFELATSRSDNRRVIEQPGYGGSVDRGGHDGDAQIRSNEATGMKHERQSRVALQAALVEFVEDHEPVIVEYRILLYHARQHALGDDLDARGRADLCIETRAVTDRAPDAFFTEKGHALGGCARGESSRLEHDDALAA